MEILILLAVNAAAFVVAYRVLKKRIQSSLDARERVRELQAEIDALLAQFNGAADRNITILEERILRLEELVRRADQRIKLLQSSVGEPAPTDVQRSAIAPTEVQESPSVGAARPNPVLVYGPSRPTPAKDRDRIEDQAARLYAEGLSVEAIARQLGISTSEVKLILSLSGVQ